MALTPKQKRFVAEYLIDLNASAAYKRAGYSGTGKTADVNASRMLANAKVAEEVKLAKKKREDRTGITQDRVLQELARLAFFDMRRLYAPDGTLKSPHDWDDDTAAALAGVEVVETQKVSVEDGTIIRTPEFVKKAKVWDKGGALTLAMRHLGMLNDKLQVDATVKGGVTYKANIPQRG